MYLKIFLGLKNLSNAKVVIEGDHYVISMTGRPTFAAPEVVAAVADTSNAIAALRTAVRAPISDSKKENVRIARDTLNRSLTKLANRVEDIANDPSIPDIARIEIANEAGMKVRQYTHRPKYQFAVVNGDNKGSVILTATSEATAHEWQYTTDVEKFTGRIAANSTTASKTVIAGLKPLTTYAFFHKSILSDSVPDWEGPIIFDVY